MRLGCGRIDAPDGVQIAETVLAVGRNVVALARLVSDVVQDHAVGQPTGMARLLDPREGLQTREIPGGTGPRAVAQALAEARERLKEMSPAS